MTGMGVWLDGWAVDVGDFIILDGEEIEILSKDDEGEVISITYRSEMGDKEDGTLDPNDTYEIWGN